MIEIIGTVKVITDSAVLIDDGDNDLWLPLSQVKTESEYAIGEDSIIEIPEWLAYEKGLI